LFNPVKPRARIISATSNQTKSPLTLPSLPNVSSLIRGVLHPLVINSLEGLAASS
jgi:hypothetical protein